MRADISKPIRVKTGVPNLDAALHGGLPNNTVTVFGGSPGSGKTILSQQICFANATPARPAIIFNTLSEPTAKTLRYLREFEFFDEAKIGRSVYFVDLGEIMRSKGLAQAHSLLLDHMKRVKPSYVVIDSFKVFEELAGSREELRKFTYEVAITLMAWECTAFLLGEFTPEDLNRNPLSSIVDGLVLLSAHEKSGEQQRFLQILKMRGTDHSREAFPIEISNHGLQLYAPRLTIQRKAEVSPKSPRRCKLGIGGLDALLGGGVTYGSSILLSGVTGTGKTLLALEALCRGAELYGEKGLFVAFEESADRLLSAAHGLDLDLEGHIKRGLIQILPVAQPAIMVEKNLQSMDDIIRRFRPKRIAVDSVSVFLQKIEYPHMIREKVYELAAVIQRAGAVGLMISDTPVGGTSLSRFGVEEVIVDGIILMTVEDHGVSRERFIEIYKMRNCDHSAGRRPLMIRRGGLVIDPDILPPSELKKPR